MRMKFNKPSQLLLVSAASLGVAGLMTACSQLTATLTVDFVYVTSAKAAGADNYGEVDVFEINSESGRMRQIPSSPFPSGGRNPVAEAVSPDNTNLYVVNQDDNSIVQFAIGSDGKVYPQNTVNTPGVFPQSVSVAKSNLFVADTYQPLPTCSPAAPCSGSIAVFPILGSSGSIPAGKLAAAVNNGATYCSGGSSASTYAAGDYWPLLNGCTGDVVAPTGINALSTGANAYVSAYDSTNSHGYVFGFSVGSDGTLAQLGPPLDLGPGVHPSAITSDPTGAFLYVTDIANAQVFGFAISSGNLTSLAGSPYKTGSQPASIAIDAAGKFAMIVESQDSTVSTYSINTGVLARVGSSATGLQPVAVGIDPRLNKYVYTANFLGNNVSGFALNQDGSMLNTQNSPFTANANPTAVAAIPHNGSTK